MTDHDIEFDTDMVLLYDMLDRVMDEVSPASAARVLARFESDTGGPTAWAGPR